MRNTVFFLSLAAGLAAAYASSAGAVPISAAPVKEARPLPRRSSRRNMPRRGRGGVDV